MSRIFKKLRTWRGGGFAAGLLGGLLALSLAPAPTTAQSVADKHQMLKDRMSLFNLAASPSVVLAVNRLQCGATSEGETCVDTFGSPTGGGGFWPTGTPDQYMFSSGLQVSGIITAGEGCTRTNRLTQNTPTCFHWSGDTTAALFFEGSGNLHHGTPITPMYNSLDPNDLAIWPEVGSVPDFPEATSMIINDTSLFNEVLIGRKAASQQDSWVAYWDGDPGKTGGRTHPMGILAEQRTLAWNYPEGNEATMYLIYRLTNVTNNELFQRLNETRYFSGLDSLPDAGWTFDSVYVAYAADPDVGPATNNQATGILPFSMAIAYEGTFNDPAFVYPADLFHAPFFPKAPGIVGMKFLKSPVDPATGEEIGLTALSLNTNGGAFPDANSVGRAWRYMSLNTSQTTYGDQPCTYPAAQVKAKRACFLGQSKVDVRIYMASGPMSLAPGQSATIASSILVAATVNTPLISTSPTGDNPPGLPGLQPGCNGQAVRAIEIASGWVKTNVCPDATDSLVTVKQADVSVVPNSLLGKALVAQSIFDNKFLLGFAPENPDFYLAPGNNQVAVIWEPSKTDVQGDPFFSAAKDPTKPTGEVNNLYDPNYRQFDVEGYRIYRGNRPGDLHLIAQFDKVGTTFVDKLCSVDQPPPAIPHVSSTPCTTTFTQELNGQFIQNRSVDQLANGSPIIITADTALANEIRAGTSKELSDTGIPFAYIDTQVRNGFTYFYKVTAFDINSAKSAPSSLESAGPFKSVVPQAASPTLQLAQFSSSLTGVTDVPLNPNAPLPSISSNNGTFSGPMPPTNSIVGTFAPLVERLLPKLSLRATVDSVKPGPNTGVSCSNDVSALGTCWNMYITFNRDGVKSSFVQAGYTPVWTSFGAQDAVGVTEYLLGSAAFHPDPTSAAQFGIPDQNVSFNASVAAHFAQSIGYSSHEGQANRRQSGGVPTNIIAGGSRWFSGDNETVPDPTVFTNVGHLEGVDTVLGIISNTTTSTGATPSSGIPCFAYALAFLGRAADVEVRWEGGKPTVFDVTHNVPVLFKPDIQASYGFLTTDANGNGFIDWQDFNFVKGAAAPINATGVCSGMTEKVTLTDTPTLVPVSTTVSGGGTSSAAPAGYAQTGMGFGMYINGERYIFQMTALPGSDKWTLRTYAGYVRASSGSTGSNPSGYTFVTAQSNGITIDRPPMIPGLNVNFVVVKPTNVTALASDLTKVHTVPDPYYGVSLFDLGPANKELQFVNLPAKATIRIYSMSGVLVDVINHDDVAGGGVAKWDLRNRSNQFVASGVYMFHVSTDDGKSHVGKFTVISSGLGQ
jgi:hypothetical protein